MRCSMRRRVCCAHAPRDARVDLALTDEPTVTAVGRVRQIDPQADPTMRTFRVRVTIIAPPPAMRLGATITGRMRLDPSAAISIPAAALTESGGQPSVWVVDPATMTVSMRNIKVKRFSADVGGRCGRIGARRHRRYRRRSVASPRPEGPTAGYAVMTEINLSAWALRHRSFVIYCMISVVIAGLNSYWSLGPERRPKFHFSDDDRAGGLARRDA